MRARASAARADQLRARADLTEAQHQAEIDEAAREEAVESLHEVVAAVAVASQEADELYEGVVAQLVVLRRRADTLLRTLEAGSRVSRPEEDLSLPDVTGELADERARLVETLAHLRAEATALDAEIHDVTWSSLGSVMKSERQLNGLRIALLSRVTLDKRARVLGFGPEGRAQGLREIERMKLEIRGLRASGWKTLRATQQDLKRPATMAKLSLQVVMLGALLWTTAVVRRRRSAWLRSVRNAIARAIPSPRLLRALQGGTAAVDAVGEELVTLAAVLLVPALPTIEVDVGPWLVPYTLLLWYWGYRFALAATHRTLEHAASRRGILAGELGHRILRSVRLVGRFAFFVAVLLASSEAVVGRGYLYALVVRGAWLIAVPVVAVVVRWWRDDIASAYLRVRPAGTLSRLVAKTRKRWVGFFVAIVAFIVLLAGGLVRSLRRFVLGFEQSRKALAFLFRRRLERKVTHTSAMEPALLSGERLHFFTEDPVHDDALVIDRYLGLRELERRRDLWRSGHRVGPTLVVGRSGYGKTSWLLAAERRCSDIPVTRLRLRQRALRPADVLGVVARAVGMTDESAVTIDAVANHLNASGKRVITVDDTQLWFLRGVDTLDGFRAFCLLMDRTSDTVLWIVTFSHYAWEFLSWVAKGDHVFRQIVHLSPWSESEIGDLLERRNQASGLEIVYDDLLVDDVSNGDASARILTTARDYNRLVWDYAEGSPRVALHMWGRSLVPDGPDRARVRLFMNPNAALLESLSESARFALAAIVWHERMTIDEVPATLLLPRHACEDAFERLLEEQVIERVGSFVRVTPRWWPVVVRYLRRKHLIET